MVLPPGVGDYPHSVIAGVDLDGQAELVAGDTLYRLIDGELQIVWDHVVPNRLMEDGFSAVGNLDGDPQAEIVYVSSGQILVLNHDGSTRRADPPFPNVLVALLADLPKREVLANSSSEGDGQHV